MSRNHPIQDSEQNVLNKAFDNEKRTLVTANVSTDGTKELFEVSKLVAQKITKSGNYTYIAVAPIGTQYSTAGWQVKRVEKSGNDTLFTWAEKDGVPTADFVHVATDLTSLTYS